MIRTPSRPGSARLLRATGLLGVAWLGSVVSIAAVGAQTEIGVPGVTGDQLLFYYDARTGRTPFLSLTNPSSSEVQVEVAFYPSDLGSRLGDTVLTLPARGNVVLDPASDTALGAVGHLGLAVATPVVSAAVRTPVVPPRPLAGSFTLANLALQAAFGENAFGRLAVTAGGARAGAGAPVDGSEVRYQRLAPERLLIPTYFNPTSLAPPENDGNRVVVALFADSYGANGFTLAAASGSVHARFVDSVGTTVAERDRPLSGVVATNLQELAGNPAALTGSGKVFLDLERGGGNAFGLFSQSLGTFASGQRLPAVAPGAGPTPTPAATPDPTPAISPSATPGAACGERRVKLELVRGAGSTTALAGVVVRLAYPPAQVAIPGSADAASVKARVDDLTGLTAGGALFDVTDTDSSQDGNDDRLNIGLFTAATPIPSGPFARVRFDCPAGGGNVTPASFACTVQASDADGASVAGVTCSVAVEP